MKKTLMLVVVLLALLVCASAAADKVAIKDPDVFPDRVFRSCLLELPEGSDGILTDAEIAGIKTLEIAKKGISDLEGIKIFTNLERLSCEGNQLKALDVSGLKKLQYLDCSENKLTALKTRGCSSLKELLAYQNALSSLDISGCSSLEELILYTNKLTSLNISSCSKLKIANFSENKLTSVTIGNSAVSLIYLDVSVNSLSSVNISSCKKLLAFYCNGNKLGSVDITGAPEIKKAYRTGAPVDEGTYIAYRVVDDDDNWDYPFNNEFEVDRKTVVLSNLVVFNANGGKGTMKPQVGANGKTIKLAANRYTRAGWIFTSWNTKKDGSGAPVKNKASFALKDQDVTLYAQWQKLKKVQGLKLKAVSAKEIRVSWKKLSAKTRKQIKKIQVQVSTSPLFRKLAADKLVDPKKASVLIRGLKKNRKYYIRVRTYTKKDGVVYVSKWSSVKSVKTKKK